MYFHLQIKTTFNLASLFWQRHYSQYLAAPHLALSVCPVSVLNLIGVGLGHFAAFLSPHFQSAYCPVNKGIKRKSLKKKEKKE